MSVSCTKKKKTFDTHLTETSFFYWSFYIHKMAWMAAWSELILFATIPEWPAAFKGSQNTDKKKQVALSTGFINIVAVKLPPFSKNTQKTNRLFWLINV